MGIKVYSKESCPNCFILKNKLKDKNVEFEEVTSEEEFKKNNIKTLPVMVVDDKVYNYYSAVQYVNKI